jgi:hypothetical protein
MHSEISTISQALGKYGIYPQDNEFQIVDSGFAASNGKIYTPDELRIIKIYRFEGSTHSFDSFVLYIIQANDGFIGYNLEATFIPLDNPHDETSGLFGKQDPEDRTKNLS